MTRLLVLSGFALAASALTGLSQELKLSAAEAKAMEARFEREFGRFQAWEKKEAKSRKGKDAEAMVKLWEKGRPSRLAYLRVVMRLEDEVRLLGQPKDEISDDLDVPGFTAQDRRRLQDLRQKIRDAERERVQAVLKKEKDSKLAKLDKELNRRSEDLDSLYERRSRSFLRDIVRANKDLDKEEKSRLPSERKIDELLDKIDELEENVAKRRELVYGAGDAEGFERSVPEEKDASSKLLAKIVTERDRVLKALRTGLEDGGENEVKRGQVGNTYLVSANLGVVLDVSGSMKPHIEKLKVEISKTFSGPRYREVVGCNLRGSQLWEYEVSRRGSSKPDTLTVIEELIVVHKVDTIFWFCDLKDEVAPAGIRRLRQLFQRSGAKFIVKSMDQKPDRSLESLITEFER